MESNTIYEIIQRSLDILGKEVKLSNSSLKVVASRSFRPIADFFSGKHEMYYNENLMNELEESYHEQLKSGMISRNVYNVRIRGIRIVKEVNSSDTFFWKGPPAKETADLPEKFKCIITGLADSSCSERKKTGSPGYYQALPVVDFQPGNP